MNREELVAAMDAGLPVRWKNDGYQLYLRHVRGST
jgi:hypothetical protein